MRKLIIALLAAGTAATAAPALAHDYDRPYYSRSDWQAERQARAAAHTRRVQEANTQRIYRETARAQARSNARLAREGRARNRANQARDARYYDDRYYDDDRYYAANDEYAFRRFADRNRDGRVSRSEYEWAQRNW